MVLVDSIHLLVPIILGRRVLHQGALESAHGPDEWMVE